MSTKNKYCESCDMNGHVMATHNYYGRMMCAKHYNITQTQLALVKHIIKNIPEEDDDK